MIERSSLSKTAIGILGALALTAGCSGNVSRQGGLPGAAVYGMPGYAQPGAPLKAELEHDTESYGHIAENDFRSVAQHPLSTFSIDVDTASYSNVRRFLKQGSLPPKDAVRIEELVNYFRYDYPEPSGDAPFSVTTELGEAPWNAKHRLVHIGLQGKTFANGQLPPRNLVFLLDVSGSMAQPNKLPLLKRSLKELVETLGENDRVAITVYAGAGGLVLPSTRASDRTTILAALDRLEAGGATNGGDGIQLAYKTARQAMIKNGINRVILATDGDFNVGMTSEGELVRLIEEERRAGVFLTVLGYGMGNLKDSTLEKLADKGNGNYAYIDNISEARKVLIREAGGTLVTIAKDVKIQVEFNPKHVSAYRLVGYENRLLQNEDFNDDTKDAGEIGAGHSVTALYEVVPAGGAAPTASVDALKYQKPGETNAAADSRELLTLKLRYKRPSDDQSELLTFNLKNASKPLLQTSESFRFSAAVAGFGMLLRDSKHKGSVSFDMVSSLVKGATGRDQEGYRREFLEMISAAKKLAPSAVVAR